MASIYTELKKRVYEANMMLARSGLVILTWGNVSEADRGLGVFAIKPSGVSYDKLTADDIVVISLATGERVEGSLRPSSDTNTHLKLYQAFENINGVCHCHSSYATAFSQAGMPIPSLGTTHADVFYNEVPITRSLTKQEIDSDYEAETGTVIVEAFKEKDPTAVPSVLVRQHGPFTWGRDGAESVEHAMVLEQVAKIAWLQKALDPMLTPLDVNLQNKHFYRKHGAAATYGQISQ